jgi:hypothetical protein
MNCEPGRGNLTPPPCVFPGMRETVRDIGVLVVAAMLVGAVVIAIVSG